ncbi:transglutaminase domain-containing protein [Actinophytocola sp. S1-96]|uniref:Transglutaminase domain-containing protein n=2 Tax=Actinophytocola gossypii TaxID=2812003 RepID=A0ABT2JCC0_9PSEU|nr:transglutaminase domain-containing protein [Actinophytocola gossypii]
MTVTPVVAAVTTLCASLALAGVIEGLRWWGYAGVAVSVVTAVGLGLRAVRTPILLVGLAQMFALLCLLVTLFTDSAVFGLFPGPDAFAELGEVLRTSVEVVRTGVPPVEPSTAVLCLVVIAIGLVAVLVDTLAVSAGTPAACGLVLLCVYAVPASLADELLPWWAFVLGAMSFAALLAVDGAHRHQQWRNRPTVQGTGGGLGSPAALVSGAVAIALFAGATVTGIGTVGQLPGNGSGGPGAGGLGLNPFTSLRGMLDRDGNVELFRVHDLGDEPRYLRALTLADYDDNGGWRARENMPRGVPADQRVLPLPPGQSNFGPGNPVEITIEPVNSEDVWAPVVGTPRQLRDLPEGMRYDPGTGIVYGERRQRLPTYVEEADLSQPSAEALRGARATDPAEIAPIYTRADGINERVVALADELTSGLASVFDQVHAIQDYFDPVNGFTYDTRTASGSDEEALVDFLFESKIGFCEQYASAMAILLRAAGIPSRVAMGYTAGYDSGDYRTITTQNAHAWVEVFFPGSGWVQFDPTPLADGTNYTPPYSTQSDSQIPEDDPVDRAPETTDPSVPAGPTQAPEDQDQVEAGGGGNDQGGNDSPNWTWWTIAALVVLSIVATGFAAARGRTGRSPLPALAAASWAVTVVFAAGVVAWWLAVLVGVLLLAALPGLGRERVRSRRRHEVHASGPEAASSAWAELMAESTDRGVEPDSAETVRAAARRLANQHELDQDGRRALRTVVAEVERSWYGGQDRPDPALATAFDRVVEGLRRTNPVGWRARLLPPSIMRRPQR